MTTDDLGLAPNADAPDDAIFGYACREGHFAPLTDGTDVGEQVRHRSTAFRRVERILGLLHDRDIDADPTVDMLDGPFSPLTIAMREARAAWWRHVVCGDSLTGRPGWDAEQCAAHANMAVSTWRSMVARDQAPEPLPGFDPTSGRRLWDAVVVQGWHATRPGQGHRGDLDAQTNQGNPR